MSEKPVLVIGNKRLSSWSLRPWLVLKHFEIPFEEVLIPLDQPNTNAEILKHSPTGRVPVLRDGSNCIWDSLAICEYLNEKFPEKNLWPSSLEERATARSISCEMHSGFQVMREIMSHDLQKNLKDFDYSKAEKDIQRVCQIWRTCLDRSGGPFLFGSFTIADAMYAPVVNRFVSYGVRCDDEIGSYIKTVHSLPAHQEWIRAGERETFEAKFH